MTAKKTFETDIPALLDRLHRVVASEGWEDDLNPAQMAALSYLSRANRFSRTPSLVAEYLGATRGTVSQTLKALLRKGLVEEAKSLTDKRSITYDVTEVGKARVAKRTLLDGVLYASPSAQVAEFERQLEDVLTAALKARGARSFGACQTCRFNRSGKDGAFCELLKIELLKEETGQICFEHAAT